MKKINIIQWFIQLIKYGMKGYTEDENEKMKLYNFLKENRQNEKGVRKNGL